MGRSHQNSPTQATKTWQRVWTTSPLTGQKWGRKPKKMWTNAWSAQRGFLWSHFCPVVTRLSAQIAGDANHLLNKAFIVGSQLEGEEVSEVQRAGGEQEDSGELKESKVSWWRCAVAQGDIKAREQERLRVLEAKMQVLAKKVFSVVILYCQTPRRLRTRCFARSVWSERET